MPIDHGVRYATVRHAIGDDGQGELHIECRFKAGGKFAQKYAPIVVDEDEDDLAHWIAGALDTRPTHRHKPSGRLYRLLYESTLLQREPNYRNDVAAIVYQSEDGRTYVRTKADFDAVFERLSDG